MRQTSQKRTDGDQDKTTPYPQIAIIVLWVAAEVILLFQDRTTALIALGFGAFMVVLWLVVKRLVPEPPASEQSVLKAVGSRKQIIARSVVVAGAIILTFVHLLAVSKVIALPGLESALNWITNLAPSLGSGLRNFALFVLLPGVLVVAFGARRRELGLTRRAWADTTD